MGCNCKWTEIVLAVVILVFSFWEIVNVSKWIILVAAIVLLLHALMCKNCGSCKADMSTTSSKKKRR